MITRREAALGGLALVLPQAARANGVIRIPLALKDGRPTVSVTINGQGPFLFGINAGQGASFVDQAVSNRLRLSLIGDALEYYQILSGNVLINTKRLNAARIAFGDAFTLKNVSMYRMPPLDRGDGIDTHGKLGRQLFVQHDCVLDFETSEIRLYPDGGLPREGFRPVAAKIGTSPTSAYGVVFDTTLEGKPFRAALSTWIRNEIILSPDYVREHGLWDRDPNFARVNTFDASEARGILMKDFHLSPFRFEEVPVYLNPPEKDSPLADYGIDGYVGLGLMSMFSIAFIGGKQVQLRPNGSGSQRMTMQP